MLPGIDGFETCRRLRDRRHLGADADAHGPRLGRRPRRGAGRGRRRLPGQAVRLRRAARAAPCARPARGGGAAGRARGRRAAARPATGEPGAGEEVSSRRRSSPCSRRSCAGPAKCSRAVPARARLGLRVREPLEHRRRLHAPTSAEDRPARRRVARDSAWGRLPAAGRRRDARLRFACASPLRSRWRWRSCSPRPVGSSTRA